MILKTLKRENVKVYFGAESSLLSNDYQAKYHGVDGFKDIFNSIEKPSLDLVQKEHAVEMMRRLIEEVKNLNIISIK